MKHWIGGGHGAESGTRNNIEALMEMLTAWRSRLELLARFWRLESERIRLLDYLREINGDHDKVSLIMLGMPSFQLNSPKTYSAYKSGTAENLAKRLRERLKGSKNKNKASGDD
ncbi:hypothetical protein BJ912DRAFT_1046064 [Pholiota molesta]|nr:hypothetical protein BJ912DRAFT_1046064 [Pholiota molesta]